LSRRGGSAGVGGGSGREVVYRLDGTETSVMVGSGAADVGYGMSCGKCRH
jgi:hypothetical protein